MVRRGERRRAPCRQRVRRRRRESCRDRVQVGSQRREELHPGLHPRLFVQMGAGSFDGENGGTMPPTRYLRGVSRLRRQARGKEIALCIRRGRHLDGRSDATVQDAAGGYIAGQRHQTCGAQRRGRHGNSRGRRRTVRPARRMAFCFGAHAFGENERRGNVCPGAGNVRAYHFGRWRESGTYPGRHRWKFYEITVLRSGRSWPRR
mmetsp:Transcript_17388/g.39248  ORF Transcript_17388/g.39248 Transcript_17388/m.39248 type:complete len:205 (+) Transcript_17388:1181-1795(+)